MTDHHYLDNYNILRSLSQPRNLLLGFDTRARHTFLGNLKIDGIGALTLLSTEAYRYDTGSVYQASISLSRRILMVWRRFLIFCYWPSMDWGNRRVPDQRSSPFELVTVQFKSHCRGLESLQREQGNRLVEVWSSWHEQIYRSANR